MALHITPETEARIAERLTTGQYDDIDDFLDKALVLLQKQEQQDHLRSLLKVGLDQFQRGEAIEYTDEVRAGIRASARRRAAEGGRPGQDVCP